jgi:hypothetical protein
MVVMFYHQSHERVRVATFGVQKRLRRRGLLMVTAIVLGIISLVGEPGRIG